MNDQNIDQAAVAICEPYSDAPIWRGKLVDFFALARATSQPHDVGAVRDSVARGSVATVMWDGSRCWLHRDATARPPATDAPRPVVAMRGETVPSLRGAAARALRFLEDTSTDDVATQRAVIEGLRQAIDAERSARDPLGEALNSGDGAYRP